MFNPHMFISNDHDQMLQLKLERAVGELAESVLISSQALVSSKTFEFNKFLTPGVRGLVLAPLCNDISYTLLSICNWRRKCIDNPSTLDLIGRPSKQQMLNVRSTLLLLRNHSWQRHSNLETKGISFVLTFTALPYQIRVARAGTTAVSSILYPFLISQTFTSSPSISFRENLPCLRSLRSGSCHPLRIHPLPAPIPRIFWNR